MLRRFPADVYQRFADGGNRCPPLVLCMDREAVRLLDHGIAALRRVWLWVLPF